MSARAFAAFLAAVFAVSWFSAQSAGQLRKASPAAQAQAQPSAEDTEPLGPHLSLWHARRMVITGLQTGYMFVVEPSSFRFKLDSFEFDAKMYRQKQFQHYQVDLKTLPQVAVHHGFGGVVHLKDEAGKDLPDPFKHLAWIRSSSAPASALARALNRLREMSGEPGMALRNFPEAAAAWRALPTKPPVPEEVRAQRLLAETALQEHQAPKALNHYETGIELYPVWPEGRFNAALIAAELQFYSEAVEQMRAYLELVPDSPDAQSAKDQIVIWQDKATQNPPASAPASPQGKSVRWGAK